MQRPARCQGGRLALRRGQLGSEDFDRHLEVVQLQRRPRWGGLVGEGDFGEAELLSKAKVTSVAGLEQTGIIHSKGGKVRLLRPDELPSDWAPFNARHSTVWGMTHHVLRLYFYEKAGDIAH